MDVVGRIRKQETLSPCLRAPAEAPGCCGPLFAPFNGSHPHPPPATAASASAPTPSSLSSSISLQHHPPTFSPFFDNGKGKNQCYIVKDWSQACVAAGLSLVTYSSSTCIHARVSACECVGTRTQPLVDSGHRAACGPIRRPGEPNFENGKLTRSMEEKEEEEEEEEEVQEEGEKEEEEKEEVYERGRTKLRAGEREHEDEGRSEQNIREVGTAVSKGLPGLKEVERVRGRRTEGGIEGG
uniref:Uncharacterized protein n=1 Tax=Vespula pensylvanica TaxID=30213 RepID=A0A834U4U3_VESPE|nr:hypothetical protein H0235_011129 [Vespula pensylvanica]